MRPFLAIGAAVAFLLGLASLGFGIAALSDGAEWGAPLLLAGLVGAGVGVWLLVNARREFPKSTG